MSDKITVISGGTVVTSDGPVRADLVIRGETIAAITEDASDVQDAERIDAIGLFVLPGGVDVHTHFREPDPRHVEGFETGSMAALAGGVTSAVEMPQAAPTSSTGAHIREKAALVEKNALIDIALWGGIVGQPPEQIQEMIDAGVVALKAFMPASSPGFPAANDQVLLDTFKFLADASSDIRFGIHCENDTLMEQGIARMQAAGRKDALAHHDSRPPLVETEAVHRALFFAELTGAWLYVCHCASGDALALIKAAKARGANVEVETCPQYLALDHDDLIKHGPFARCAPAIRDRAEVERIWEYVADGTIDVISSDHCGYTVEEKQAGLDDIWKAPLGLSGVQTMYPAVFDEMINKRGMSLEHFAALSATNPAKVFSLYPRKGVIRVGSDADLAFYDPNRAWDVHGSDMLHRNKWTPFEGRTIGSSVVKTMVRGRVAFDASQAEPVLSKAGDGKFLSRGYGAS